MPRKPKHKITVDLPSEFTDFMRQVHEQIVSGDEAATVLESDDLLQCDCAYGGLYYDAQKPRFGFRYFYDEDVTWDFDLDARQIAEIADGTVTAVELWQCSGGKCGCLYSAEDTYCPHCDSLRHFDNFESEVREFHPDESEEVLAARVNLHKVILAIGDYHREHDHFPPPYTRDGDGKLLHSWRSLILPFLDEDSVFEMIDFTQPWDSEANRQVWEHRPEAYGGNGCPAPMTPCVAIVGRNTLWPPTGTRRYGDIRSGTSFTTAAVVANETRVNWMQPADINVETAVAEYRAKGSLLMSFVDGHVGLIDDVTLKRLRELIRV